MIIEPERLQNIPPEYHQQHSFCFWLHDVIADVLRQAERARIADVTIQFKDQDEANAFHAAGDPVTWCLENGRHDAAKRIVLNHIVVPLYSDILHFVFDGLRALEKRKFAVAFNTLRKPFKYGLTFATWLFADQEDFFARLRTEPADSFDDRKVSKEQRIRLITKAVESLKHAEFLSADVIFGMAFDRSNPRGLAQHFDKAAHLVTSHPAMRTENLNLNFIFKNPSDADVYEGVYFLLAYLLMYLLLLEIATIDRMAKIPDWYTQWVTISTLTIHESLWLTDSSAMIDSVNQLWGELFMCAICNRPLSLTPDCALRFFAMEHIQCAKCKTDQNFPIFWLMSKFGSDTKGNKSLSEVRQ